MVLLVGCAAAPGQPPDAGSPPVEDAGLAVDAGVDAGTMTPTWGRTADAPISTGLWGTVLTFDPVERRFLLHGGNAYPRGSVQADTWSFSLASGQWTKLSTSGDAPPPRYCHCATLLPDQRQLLIAGGRDERSTVDSAFTLDLQTLRWSRVQGPVPSGAIGCAAHWMPSLAKAIVFGGDGPTGVNNLTWAYEPVARSFEQLQPTARPFARRDAMSIYEPLQGRLVMFGGAVAITASYLDDVAIFDGTRWFDQQAPDPHPTPRRYGASGYDPLHQRWLLFGGTNDTDDFDDLWVIDPILSEFARQSVPGGPSRRAFAASGVDETTGTLYVFGGLQTAGFVALAEGWTLQLR